MTIQGRNIKIRSQRAKNWRWGWSSSEFSESTGVEAVGRNGSEPVVRGEEGVEENGGGGEVEKANGDGGILEGEVAKSPPSSRALHCPRASSEKIIRH